MNWRRIKGAWIVFIQNRLAIVGLGLLIIFLLMALAHPILISTVWPRGIYHPITGFDMNVIHPSMPSAKHPLGTTIKGLDILSLLLAATRHSFSLGLTAGAVAAMTGTILGVLGAYIRGNLDTLLSQISNVFLLLPPPIFMAFAGSTLRDLGPIELGIVYGLIAGLGNTAILMRTYALTILAKPYIEAARAAGGSVFHIVTRHVLPHMLPMAVLQMLLAVTGAVIVDGYLSYSGGSGYVVNWGTMLKENEMLHEVLGGGTQWFAIFSPVIAFTLFGLAFYLISRGMHQIADPQLRKQ